MEGISDLQVCHLDAHGREIPLKQMGTGRRRQVSLAVWEWTKDILRQGVDAFDSPIVIAYDEPDTHLDYGHQRKLMDLLHEQCSNPRVRMIVATHSLNLIDRVDIQDVIHFRLDGDRRTVIERLLSTDHQRTNEYLARISSAVGLSNSVLLHERCFVGVEGPTELECLPVLFRLALGVPMQSVGIALVNGGNNVGALQLVKYLNSAGRRVAFILDRDCISVQGERRTFDPRKLKANGFIDDQINYIGTKELEDLFSDEQWAVAANQACPRDDGEEWKSEHIADLRSGRKFSDLLLQVVRTNSSEAPANKQSLVVELACRLISPDDVPVELVATFNKLINHAGATA